jgi:hypothetical protein
MWAVPTQGVPDSVLLDGTEIIHAAPEVLPGGIDENTFVSSGSVAHAGGSMQ